MNTKDCFDYVVTVCGGFVVYACFFLLLFIFTSSGTELVADQVKYTSVAVYDS